MASEIVEIEGHIIDSLILAKVLDQILAAGADYRVLDVEIGRTSVDVSRVSIEVTAPDADGLDDRSSTSCRSTAPTGWTRPTPSW